MPGTVCSHPFLRSAKKEKDIEAKLPFLFYTAAVLGTHSRRQESAASVSHWGTLNNFPRTFHLLPLLFINHFLYLFSCSNIYLKFLVIACL